MRCLKKYGNLSTENLVMRVHIGATKFIIHPFGEDISTKFDQFTVRKKKLASIKQVLLINAHSDILN